MSLSRKSKKFIIIGTALLLLYALVGFVAIPWVIESKLPPMLSEQVGRPVLLKDVEFNPFVLSLRAHNFEIQESDQTPLIGFQELFINFQLSSIFRGSYTFDEIRLLLPYGLIKIRPDGSLNVVELSQSSTNEAEAPEPEPSSDEATDKGLPAIDVFRLAIEQGVIEFHDESKPTPFSADIVPIQITLNNFSTHPDSNNPHAMTAEFTEGESLSWEGTFALDPFRSEGTLALSGLKLRTAWEYLQDQLRFEIKDGVLNVTTKYRLEPTSEGLNTKLSSGKVNISQFKIVDNETREELISIPTFDVEGIDVNVPRQEVTIPSIHSRDAWLKGWLNPDGSFNYQTMFAANNDSTEEGRTSNTEEPGTPSDVQEKPWLVLIQDFTLENYAAAFEDRTPQTSVQLEFENINFSVKNVSSKLDQPVDLTLSLSLNKTGTMDIKGTAELDPVVADVELQIGQLALNPFEPYLEPFVQLRLASGALDLQGNVQYQSSPAEHSMLHYEGNIALSQFGAADFDHSEEFLKWDSLALQDIIVDVEPTSLTVGTIKLNKLSAKTTIASDGTMNLTKAFSPPQDAEEPDTSAEENEEEEKKENGEKEKVAPQETQDPVPVKIDTVQINKASADFTDQSVTPHVVMGIQDFSGTIQGLSSKQLAKAKVDLKGKVDKYAPISIKGQINPLSKDLYTDLTFLFQNWNLTTVSPYSGTYAGYPITKGKLSLDLKYKVSENSLLGENKILVDQLTMGDHIDSPDAPSLPIPLAIALLKDRKGQIDIDLPVEGDLNDPEFSYGGLIIQALVNLITKAATSPFAALGNLIEGSEEDFQFVEFLVGSIDLPEKESEKLATLAKALEERPGLRLEITGASDTKTDRLQLAEGKLLKNLKMAKIQQSSPSGSLTPQAVETVELSQEEEARLIKQLFEKQFGKDNATATRENEKTVSGGENPSQQEFSVEIAKQRLLDTIQVDEAELRQLARERAKAIQDYLIQLGNISEDRVFLTEVQVITESAQEMIRSPLSLTAG